MTTSPRSPNTPQLKLLATTAASNSASTKSRSGKSGSTSGGSKPPRLKSVGASPASAPSLASTAGSSLFSNRDLERLGPDAVRQMVNDDPDFVAIPRHGCSLARVVAAYPNGAPDRVIAQALSISEADLESTYASIVAKLQSALKIT